MRAGSVTNYQVFAAQSLSLEEALESQLDESATSAVERTIETIVESHTRSFDHALGELARLAPDAPLLSCGQTVFWDEPMKVGVALAAARLKKPRRFVAAVHDTDYFAKHPGGKPRPGRFRALPHNDTTTRG
ncbi:MAG: hypothetical protein HY248_04540, partial [Fimbriimonas ginsengisoli]|nr:hypothetical protein [Fimbriimonas ginsengisoli]